MKKNVRIVLRWIPIFLFISTVSLFADDFKSPVSKLDVQDGDSIVFLGDSITHQCLYTQYVEDFFYTRYPKMRLKFHNSGVGGARAKDALERFDRDVAAYKPKYVTVLLGMNDGTYRPYDEETFRTYHADMTELIGRIEKIGAIPVLMTPTIFDSRAARLGKRQHPAERLELYNSVLAYYGTWLREVAVEHGYGFVDMYSPLNNFTLQQRKSDPNFTMIVDAVHPGPSGQLVMAYAIIEDMGLRGPVSNIRILNAGGNAPKFQTSGGKVTDLRKTQNGVEFTFTAERLPWILPAEAKVGVELLKLGHRASREGVEIHGLPAGRYQFSIDGEPVGVFNSVQLARHIELQDNDKTPQYQQALKVAELNKQRNDGPVKLLRNEWRTFQQYSRMVRTPVENENVRKRIANLKQQLEGLEERINKHEQAARELEDQIFQINQPAPHKYVLKKVENAAVSGMILLDGHPVVGATIRFRNSLGNRATARTNPRGEYVLKPGRSSVLGPGNYSVSITGKVIPKKYSEPLSSPLRAEVARGKNKFNFELVSN